MATNAELLALAFPDEYDKIEAYVLISHEDENFDWLHNPDRCSRTPSDALARAFTWSKTREGDDFWRRLQEAQKEKEAAKAAKLKAPKPKAAFDTPPTNADLIKKQWPGEIGEKIIAHTKTWFNPETQRETKTADEFLYNTKFARKTAAEALDDGFTWVDSPECHDYWYEIYLDAL